MKLRILAAAMIVTALGALSACNNETDLSIETVGDTMAYNTPTLEAKAGSTVKLTLKNNATSPAMQHNWTLVKAGTEQAVALAGITAGADKGYIPEGNDNVIAHTTLTKPGETTTITFTAPATAGDYPYICTFPGHYPMMKGTLKVN